MQFDSFAFLGFVGVVWLAYQLTREAYRWLVLLGASMAFYATLRAPLLLLSLGAVSLASYWLAVRIASATTASKRGQLLWGGVALNLLVLCLVKYWRQIAGLLFPSVVPWANDAGLFITIGISYFTLQAIAYLVDVYLELAEPESHFGRFTLYLSFFPKLLQGPIERAGDLLPQLRASSLGDYESLRSGAVLIGWGLFKKAAVANRLAPYVNTVYGDVHAYGGVSLLMATYLYALQIYADFSGYTDIALGVARLFNVNLTQNFKAPYLASSVPEFWRRWHISFSRWLLDYLFRPLQVAWRHLGILGMAAALFVTFLVSGLWHGLSGGFLVWGGLHGVYLAATVLCAPGLARFFKRLGWNGHPALKLAGILLTFHLVCFGWIFFRANSLSDGWYVATHLFSGVGGYVHAVLRRPGDLFHHKELWDPILLGKTLMPFLLLCVSLAVMCFGSLSQGRLLLSRRPVWLRWPAYYGLAFSIAFLSSFDNVGFVYFQF